MAKIPNPFSRMQIEFRRSRPLTKIVVCGAIVLSMAALITLRLAQDHILAQTDDMRSKAAYLEHENAKLDDRIENMDSVQGVEQIAKEELGLVHPDTVIVDPES